MSQTIPLIEQIRQCKICEPHLPLGARPVLQFDTSAKILVAGQAPGRKVHQTGLPFDDASGDRLRHWMGLERSIFYDAKRIAIIPMGFCYPGTGSSGDLPPRPECARTWHSALLQMLPNLQLCLIIGKYALDYHFQRRYSSVTDAVTSWQEHWPNKVALPHPSPRNNLWLRNNAWFEQQVIPNLRQRVAEVLL